MMQGLKKKKERERKKIATHVEDRTLTIRPPRMGCNYAGPLFRILGCNYVDPLFRILRCNYVDLLFCILGCNYIITIDIKVVLNPVFLRSTNLESVLIAFLSCYSFGNLQLFTVPILGDSPGFLSALASNNVFIIKLVQM